MTEYRPGNPEKLGVTNIEEGYNFAIVSEAEKIELCLYKEGYCEPAQVYELDESCRYGSIYAVWLPKSVVMGCSYNYKINGNYILDPYAKSILNANDFGIKRENVIYSTPVVSENFDWEGDRQLHIPFSEIIMYKLHVRGFTKHSSSKVTHKGTFAGVLEKLDYIKSLGVNAIELMPVHEFEEVQKWSVNDKNSMYNPKFDGRTNYWGYTDGLYFAPKSAYCTMKDKSPCVEFKELVKTMHQNGIEVVLEMFFSVETDINLIRDCVRYWALEYHIDGMHLICSEDALKSICDDPLLSKLKIFTPYWENKTLRFGYRHLANYNNGFMDAARKFLKGDENSLGAFIDAVKCNSDKVANVNYVANNNGFTLMDLVSYDRKHNEVNGENNRDGEDFNNSWNCGAEGVTRKKKILDLRIKQIKNALIMLMLSQGVPLIMAGDEFCNTQEGNNNPYCQDNEISYINWKNTAYSRDILEFTKYLIAFRKQHGVFKNDKPLRDMDYLACGYPDISYHGENAWMANFENYYRNIGVMYYGDYGNDDSIYIAYNMHWEEHTMALPTLKEGYEWFIDSYTSKNGKDCSIENRKIRVSERMIVVLIARKVK